MSFSLSGIASGIDTNAIISQLMQIERIPYNKLQNTRNAYNSQLSVFRTINTKLSTLRTAAEDLRLMANFNLKSIKISNETVLKATASDAAHEGVYVVQVDKLAAYSTFATDAFDASGTSLAALKEITIGLDGNETVITIDENLSGKTNDEILDIVAKKINGNKDLGVRAAVIQNKPGQKALMLTAKEAGEIEITLNANVSLGGKNEKGQYAKFSINGIEFQSSSNEVKDVINGLTLTLLKEGTSTITIARDADKVAEKVEAFVNAYNDVINTIRSNTAKGASLQGDFTLRSLQDQLWALFNGAVGPESLPGGNPEAEGEDGDSTPSPLVYRYLFQIGLEIDKGAVKGSDMTGTIKFDKEKFKQALEQNPEAVYQLFAYNEKIPGATPGIAERFSEALRVWTRAGTGILAAKIEGFNEQIEFVTKQMESMEVRLAMREEQLKKQFSSMEVALSSLQNQMAWLSSQLAALMVQSQVR